MRKEKEYYSYQDIQEGIPFDAFDLTKEVGQIPT